MTDLLLDTHVLLWVLRADAALGASARSAIEQANAVHCSAVSIAEVRIKQMLGRLQVPDDLVAQIADAGIRFTVFDEAAADSLPRWPELVRHDPFDRLLLAQAATRGLRLVTGDRVLLALPDAPVLDARA